MNTFSTSRRTVKRFVLFLFVIFISFGCVNDDDDASDGNGNDDSADDSISDDDTVTQPASQECPPPSDSYDGVECDYVDDFFFREDWMDYSFSWPDCPWEFETTGNAELQLMESDEIIPPDWPLERNLHISAVAPETQGSVTISRITPPPECEYTLDNSFTLNFRAGGVFTIGLGSPDPLQRAVAVLDAREDPPALFAVDIEGEWQDCGTFPVGEWIRVLISVSEGDYRLSVRRESDFNDITGQCIEIPWRDTAAPEFLGGIVMETGPVDGAEVDVNFLVFDRVWPDEP